jgi:hypothetical protein
MVSHLLIYAAPCLRLAFILGKPTLDLLYHKIAHGAIHRTVHGIPQLHHKAFKFLPDVLMVFALLLLELVTEHFCGHHTASE